MASTNISTPSPQTIQSHVDAGTAHANPTWREIALIATARLARERERFTSFDVLQELEKSAVTTHDLRAIGGVMKEASELGLITGVGFVRRNDKFSRGITTVWQSSLHCPSAQTTTSAPEPEL